MRSHSIYVASALLVVTAGTASAEEDDRAVAEVFFEHDSAELSQRATEKLDKAAEAAMASPGARIVLDGHADPRGTEAYNVGLSIRRAESVRDHLVAQGVDRDNIIMAYYGENAPRRDSFAEDRRVGVELTRDPLYVVIDRALPVATAVTWQRPATTAEIEGPPLEQVARQ